MAEHWMEILRPGEWNEFDFSASYIRDLQASYDPTEIEAPLVVGHPDPFGPEQPAYGWVKALEIRKQTDAETNDDISLWALTDFNDEAENMIREKQFPKRSVGVANKKGIPYLRHVALLGASNPAVSSLEDVKLKELFKAEDGVIVTLSVSDKMIELVWESKEKEYSYRLRPPTRFMDDSIKSFNIKGVTGIKAVSGKLKGQYVPEGRKADSMVVQSLRFDKKEFDLSAAKAWVTSHKKELSRMSETITLTEDEQILKLKADNAKLQAQMDETVKDSQEQKLVAEKAIADLEVIRLAALEGKFEHELNALVDDGNGVPAYIEAGVHKALVAVDGVEVTLADGKTINASTLFMNTLKAMPKVIETKEVSGATGDKDKVDLTAGIPADDRFHKAMAGYKAEGKSVIGLEFVELANKIEKEEKCSPMEAARKAMTLGSQGGK